MIDDQPALWELIREWIGERPTYDLWHVDRHGISRKCDSNNGCYCVVYFLFGDGVVYDKAEKDRNYYQAADPNFFAELESALRAVETCFSLLQNSRPLDFKPMEVEIPEIPPAYNPLWKLYQSYK